MNKIMRQQVDGCRQAKEFPEPNQVDFIRGYQPAEDPQAAGEMDQTTFSSTDGNMV